MTGIFRCYMMKERKESGMELEYIAQRKKPFRSDFIMLLLVLAGLVIASMLLAYMEQALQMKTQVLQFVLFGALILLCYFILHKQMLSYRYVLKPGVFLVYRRIGRKESMVEQVDLAQAQFLSPYISAPGQRGRENALCTGKRQQSYVLAHMQQGKLQWLLFSPNDALLRGLQSNILAARAGGAAQPREEGQ